MSQLEKTEATEDTPQFVKDCLKAVKEGVHTKGDQDGMCWALYNKHKKEGSTATFKVEMLETSNPIEQKLLERGHSDPQKGSKNIKSDQFQGIDEILASPGFQNELAHELGGMAYDMSAGVNASDLADWLKEAKLYDKWKQAFNEWDRVHSDLIRKLDLGTATKADLFKFGKATKKAFEPIAKVESENVQTIIKESGHFHASAGRQLLRLGIFK
jgi:hypothetical protein